MLSTESILPIIADAINARLESGPRVYPPISNGNTYPEAYGTVSVSSSSDLIPGNLSLSCQCALSFFIDLDRLADFGGEITLFCSNAMEALVLALRDLVGSSPITLPNGTAHIYNAYPTAAPSIAPQETGWQIDFDFILFMQL